MGHSYSSATCTEAEKCSRCDKTGSSALGHTTNGTKCTRCGVVTFETITYSGTGSSVKNDINLPLGKFRITCTLYYGSYTTIYLYLGDREELIFNHYDPNTTEITMIYGPISNASIVINGESSYSSPAKWKITIEAIG